jgi:hypothetical protein
VSELKTLEQDKEAEHAKKIQELSLDWRRRGLLRGYGRFTIYLQNLHPKCQRDWLDVLEPPVYKLIRDANRQIRSTKEHLKLDGYKGLLLIANDGNFLHTDPVNYMILVARMLQKKRDGQPRFPHVDGVVYFSHRIGSRAEGVPFWAPGTTAVHDPAMRDFQEKLQRGWFSYVSELAGQPIKQILKDAENGIPAHLGAEVTGFIRDGEHVVHARMYCKKDNCGRDVEIVSDGPETRQFVECPVHGEIVSFQNYDECERVLKFVINKVAEAKGRPQIGPDVKGRLQRK